MGSRTKAPGRVNLIGEHTDYNDGFVMPVAIGYATQVEAAPRGDGIVAIVSDAVDGPAEFRLGAISRERRNDWADYARGILIELERLGVALIGTDARVSSTVPLGAGLSSSASFEVALTQALLGVAGAALDPRAIAGLAQRAEHEGAGVRSGIMDQFAVLFGKAGRATLLDTRSLEVTHLPIPGGTRVAICNTMVKHALSAGQYNARRAECERAVELLRQWYPGIAALRDVTLAQLERRGESLPEAIYRRARHVVSENARVCDAADALTSADPARFGRLMNASHESLRDDYEVSCAELDAMVAAARSCAGVFGARMTGGGFGGCTVNLVEAGALDDFRRDVTRAYYQATGIETAIYDGTPVDGAASDG
jgi:galactokinase